MKGTSDNKLWFVYCAVSGPVNPITTNRIILLPPVPWELSGDMEEIIQYCGSIEYINPHHWVSAAYNFGFNCAQANSSEPSSSVFMNLVVYSYFFFNLKIFGLYNVFCYDPL